MLAEAEDERQKASSAGRTPLWPSFKSRGQKKDLKGTSQVLKPLLLPDVPTSAPKTASRGAMWRTRLAVGSPDLDSPGPSGIFLSAPDQLRVR